MQGELRFKCTNTQPNLSAAASGMMDEKLSEEEEGAVSIPPQKMRSKNTLKMYQLHSANKTIYERFNALDLLPENKCPCFCPVPICGILVISASDRVDQEK